MTINNIFNNKPYSFSTITDEKGQRIIPIPQMEQLAPFYCAPSLKRAREAFSSMEEAPSVKRIKQSTENLIENRTMRCAVPILPQALPAIPIAPTVVQLAERICGIKTLQNQTKIINILNAIPENEREEIVTFVQQLISPKKYSTLQLLKTLQNINPVERREIVAIVQRLSPPAMNSREINSLIKAVQAIGADRTETARRAKELFSLQMTGYDKAKILLTIAKIPAPHREEMFRLVPWLLQPNMSSSDISSILRPLDYLIAKRNAFEREEIIQLALTELIVPGMDHPGFIISALSEMEDAAEREAIVKSIFPLRTPNMSGADIGALIRKIHALPSSERDDIIQHALPLIQRNPQMHVLDKMTLLETVAIIPAPHRAEYVQQRIEARRIQLNKLNVHEDERDLRTREAIELLIRQQPNLGQITGNGPVVNQGEDAKKTIKQAVTDFVDYIHQYPMTPSDKQLVHRALHGQAGKKEEFLPMLHMDTFNIAGLHISGVELIGRLWLFVSILPEPDQTNAKRGMIAALQNSYDMGELICEQGRAQKLVTAALQGRLEKVNLDTLYTGAVPTTIAERVFFTYPKHQEIQQLDQLLSAVEQFLQENPLVNKEEFMQAMHRYAQAGGIT